MVPTTLPEFGFEHAFRPGFRACHRPPVLTPVTAEFMNGVAPSALDEGNAERLWDESVRMLGGAVGTIGGCEVIGSGRTDGWRRGWASPRRSASPNS
ncbi:hypothetical protein NWFMUON74_45920 [Nocardia wallacei]|uniref:Uncharacterized protein n=1 Tax=Nocardia wallacei TaxID=480035 RepID=A0A7G1KNX1_9NOCA|nr:hypothetical protein NWFMUON74_45920 [Nocardia wallacei]